MRSGFLRILPGVLDYTGEFGAELVLFLPFCEWLSSKGVLHDRSIRTYAGMRCFYDHLQCRAVMEKTEGRRSVPPSERPKWLPIRDEHDFDVSISRHFFVYPDLRARFADHKLPDEIALSNKPLLVVHNKYNVEWGIGPMNYISLDSLDRILSRLTSVFTIIYVRHGAGYQPGYSRDHNTPVPFDDAAVLSRHPTVINFEELHRLRSNDHDTNTLKNAIFSRCYYFISSQGGGSYHMALFSGSLMAVLHRHGRETEAAYSAGYYSFMADPPPKRAICSGDEDLDAAISIFANSNLVNGTVRVNGVGERVLQRLAPERFLG